jgi:uncharacterized membrane protein YagU involved in acid resistance
MAVAVRFVSGSAVVAGIAGGVIFAAFEMLAAATLMGTQAVFMPLRMIGAMVLGAQALDPTYSLVVAGVVGLAVHLILSIAFATVFALIASPLSTAGSLALGGIAFGIALWIVNFYVLAPLAGWSWFPDRSNPVVQFVAHALFFGCPVGWYLGRHQRVVGSTIVP